MPYEDLLLAERKGVWRRLAGRVLELDLTRDLASVAQAAHEQSISDATEKARADQNAQQDLERRKQQEHAAKVQELLQSPSWIQSRDLAFRRGDEAALQKEITDQAIKAEKRVKGMADIQAMIDRQRAQRNERDHGMDR